MNIFVEISCVKPPSQCCRKFPFYFFSKNTMRAFGCSQKVRSLHEQYLMTKMKYAYSNYVQQELIYYTIHMKPKVQLQRPRYKMIRPTVKLQVASFLQQLQVAQTSYKEVENDDVTCIPLFFVYFPCKYSQMISCILFQEKAFWQVVRLNVYMRYLTPVFINTLEYTVH